MSALEGVETEISHVISDVCWETNYKLGCGIDGVTGFVKASPFRAESLQLTKNQPKYKSSSKIVWIRNQKEKEKNFASLSENCVNFKGLSLSADLELKKSIAFSETSVSALFESRHIYDEYHELQQPVLTEAAEELLSEGSQENFRNCYGDYFIAGCKKAATFKALFVFRAQSSKDLVDIESKFSAVFLSKSTGSGKSEANASKKFFCQNVHVEVLHTTSGEEKSYPYLVSSIEDVVSAYSWFEQNFSGCYAEALLHRYQTIFPKILPHADLSKGTFVYQQQINKIILRIENEIDDVHEMYKQKFQEEVNRIKEENNTVSCSLSQNRRKLFDEAKKVQTEIEESIGRKKFFEEVNAMKSSEPGYKTYKTNEVYGFTRERPLSGVSVYERRFPKLKLESAYEEKPFKVDNMLIVGWSVCCQRNNKYWWKNKKWLLEEKVEIGLGSTGWWEVTLYVVEAEKYNFCGS